MKKVLSLILALAMIASFAMVASAADFEFELSLLDADQENAVTEINVGDKFYLVVEASTKTAKYGYEINIDTTAFEVDVITEDGDSWEDHDGGNHTGTFVVNPSGQTNVMSFTGAKTGATKAISNTTGFIAKTAGTYEISFKGQQDKNMPTGAASTGNSVTLKVLGDAVDTAVTFDTTGVKGIVENAVTTAVDGTVTIDVTPAFGSKIANVVTTDGTASYTANGGTITISGLKAETATVTITTAEDDATGVVTFATPYVDGDTAYVFGKVTNVADEFGVKLDGEAYAANNATAEKVFGIAFKGLVAGTYSAAAYDSTADGNAIDVVIAE